MNPPGPGANRHPQSILAIGSVAFDSVETPHGCVERVIGGSAVFFCAAASLFAGVRVVGVVGDDYPLGALAFLEARGVDLAGLVRLPGESFFWAGRYHEGFRTRETLATRLGVFASFDPEVPAAWRDSRLVFLGNIDPMLQLRVLDQVRSPGLVAADTMNYWIDGSQEALLAVLARIDVLFVNDEEAMQLAGEADPRRAARWIRNRGAGMVVMKRGADGAVLFGSGWTVDCPGHPVGRVVDPTGAGDAFAGGFLGFLARRGSWTQADLAGAVAHGAATGSCAVEAFSIDRFRGLTREDVESRAALVAEASTPECSGDLLHGLPGGQP
ncbi:MAG: PfkB family carbohydrate kinase [Gemmatimonadota bacterium]|nr:PfkB family carbohydrate kinase [Gemmatimonadota bacterium]